MIVFVDNTALDEGGTEELAVVVSTFVGKSEEGKEDHRAKYRRPTAHLKDDMEGAILDPDNLWEEVDTTEIGVGIRPASPRRKWGGGGVEVDLDDRYRCSAHKFHPSKCHQTEVSASGQ